MDLGALAGVDFAVTESFLIGAGVDYNFNVFPINRFNYAAYNLPPGTQSLETISFWTLKLSIKWLF